MMRIGTEKAVRDRHQLTCRARIRGRSPVAVETRISGRTDRPLFRESNLAYRVLWIDNR
jgi:hypothetical protein